MDEQLKLTDREIAIAQGRDPDATEAKPVVEDTAGKDAGGQATDGQVGQQPVKEDGPSAESGGGKEAASSTESPKSEQPWFKDEHKELASSYGLTDEDLKDFGNEAEFSRATRLIDRQFAAAGQAAKQGQATTQQGQPQSTQAATQQIQPQATQAAPAQSTAPAGEQKFEKLDLNKLKEAGYDEQTLDWAAKHNKALEAIEGLQSERAQERQVLAQIHRQFVEQDYVRHINAFHDAVDGLGGGRYGKSVGDDGRSTPLSKEQDAARAKLFESADTLARGIAARQQASGQPVQLPPMASLLRRAEQLAFAEDIRAEERRKVQEQVTEQSKRRRPVATARNGMGQFAKEPRQFDNPTAAAKQVASHPDIVKLWNQFQEQNGAA